MNEILSPDTLDQNFNSSKLRLSLKTLASRVLWIKILELRHCRCFLSESLRAVLIEALPTPRLPLIKILSLRKASLTPPKSKFRRYANSFNKIQTPFLPIVSIKILSLLLQVVCDQNSIIAYCISKALPPLPHRHLCHYCRSSKRRKALRVAHAPKLPKLRVKRKCTATLLRYDDRSAIKFPPPRNVRQAKRCKF